MKLLIINTMVSPSGIVLDQVCTGAEAVLHKESCRLTSWTAKSSKRNRGWQKLHEQSLGFFLPSDMALFEKSSAPLTFLSEHYWLSCRVTERKATIFFTGSMVSSLSIKRQGWFTSLPVRLEDSLRNRTIRINWVFHNQEFYGHSSLALKHMWNLEFAKNSGSF